MSYLKLCVIFIIGIYAVSTLHPDPVNACNQLQAQNNWPLIFEKGFLDPNVLKHFLLVQDCSNTKDAE